MAQSSELAVSRVSQSATVAHFRRPADWKSASRSSACHQVGNLRYDGFVSVRPSSYEISGLERFHQCCSGAPASCPPRAGRKATLWEPEGRMAVRQGMKKHSCSMTAYCGLEYAAPPELEIHLHLISTPMPRLRRWLQHHRTCLQSNVLLLTDRTAG